jgi:hypothetical protein
MTNYIRFFHVQLYHLRFVGIEALVTLVVLLLFVLLPARFLAFFPHRSFHCFARKRLTNLAIYSRATRLLMAG